MKLKIITYLFLSTLAMSSCVAMNPQPQAQGFSLQLQQARTLDLAIVVQSVQEFLQQGYLVEQIIASVQNNFELPQDGTVLVQKICQLSQQGLSVQQILSNLENEYCDEQVVMQDNTWKWLAVAGACLGLAGLCLWYAWHCSKEGFVYNDQVIHSQEELGQVLAREEEVRQDQRAQSSP